MSKVKIEMTQDQIDAIVLKELQETLERNLDEYHNKVGVCEKRKHHRRLIEGLHSTVAYFMDFNAFQAYADTLNWPKKMKRDQYDWI
jgi:hypothetical protein